MSFFGLELAPGKTYKQKVEIPFRVGMVALGAGQLKKERSTLTVSTEDEEGEFALCSLTPGSLEQQNVDLVFEEGEEVSLHVHGPNKMFLTGNYADEDEMMDMPPYSDEEEFEDEEIPSSEEEEIDEDEIDAAALKAVKPKKSVKIAKKNDEAEASEEEEEMDTDDMEMLMQEEDSEEDDYDLDSDEELDMEELFKQIYAERLAEGASVEEIEAELQAMQDMVDEEEDSEEEEEDNEEEEEEPRITEVISETTNLDANGNEIKTVEDVIKVDAPKAKKAEQKPKKEVPAKKENKKVEAAKPAVNDKKRPAEEKQKAAAPAEKKAKIETKTLSSGVQITDTKVGDGARAKSGKRISMHYVGKLTSNGKQFDATKGKPFDFALGRGQVIKGFDLGVDGMQVGGERRIVIPANMAYGKKALPGIPANSSLTFDIKLVNVK